MDGVKRQYVRRLPLQALYNCRDLGGYAAAGGGVTRFGVFLRSEAPCDLPQSDLDALLRYGVTTTIDLRGTGEVRARPSDLRTLAQITYHHRSLFNEAAIFDKSQIDPDERAAQAPPPGGGHRTPGMDWGTHYRQMAEDARDWACDVLQIAAGCPGALLYHCTTGKDRTGLLSCYLLSIAGVSREDIAADYCVSQIYLQPVYDRMRRGAMDLGGPGGPGGNAPPMDDDFFATRPESMLSLIDYLTEKYGGVVPYLRSIGVGEAVMERIRAKLTEG